MLLVTHHEKVSAGGTNINDAGTALESSRRVMWRKMGLVQIDGKAPAHVKVSGCTDLLLGSFRQQHSAGPVESQFQFLEW